MSDNENIILHLPIHSDQLLNNEFGETKLFEYDPDISVPKPYEEAVHSHPFSNNNSAPYPFDKENIEINEKIEEKDNKFDDNTDNSSEDNVLEEKSYRKINLKYEDDNILSDNKENNEIMASVREDNYFQIKLNNSGPSLNVKNTMVQFKETNNRKTWPENTNIHCWWCCSPFNNTPFALPVKKNDNHYSVIGCFCSPECCASWNFNDDNENKWERYSLLNMVYSRIFDNIEISIKTAPPRESLKMFGGQLTIEEFRKNSCNYNKNYSIVLPPMVSLIPQLEESISDTFYTKKKTFIPVDRDRIDKANSELKLRRSKPLSDTRNTLENCMKLKYL
jgi:hypothetical protein